jgi:hypothetical protein
LNDPFFITNVNNASPQKKKAQIDEQMEFKIPYDENGPPIKSKLFTGILQKNKKKYSSLFNDKSV